MPSGVVPRTLSFGSSQDSTVARSLPIGTGDLAQRAQAAHIIDAVAIDQVVAVLRCPDLLAQLGVAVGAPQTAGVMAGHAGFTVLVVEHVVGQPLTDRVQVFRRLGAVDVLHRVRVHVAADEAATGGQAVVAVGLFVVTAQRDRVAVHDAVGTVGRVTTLAAAAAAGRVGEVDAAAFGDLTVTPVDRLGDRLDGIAVHCGRLDHRDHVVAVALLADHAFLAQAGILRNRIVGASRRPVGREAGALVEVVQRQHVDRCTLQAGIPVGVGTRNDVVVRVPELVLGIGDCIQAGAGERAAVRECRNRSG